MMVMDSYALPVEGTETRVNAQAQAYEYMATYMERAKQVGRAVHSELDQLWRLTPLLGPVYLALAPTKTDSDLTHLADV